MNESYYMFVYWILGTFFDDLETLTLGVGLVRSFESLGTCLAFGVGAVRVRPITNLIVAFVMFCLTIPTTSWVVFLVPERPKEYALDREVESVDGKHAAPGPVQTTLAAGAVDGPRNI